MRVTADKCRPSVMVDRALLRPVAVILFGDPGLRLALSSAEALELADQLVDAAERADAPRSRPKKKRRKSNSTTTLENKNG
ncbi:hypothetical protein [Rhodococcoides yunnanense]|jgi:hypothetical protein|uniref:hypothetical protein n=1 Tax=Rhodococcoides yunnanense TaxID=278209 RepID=UPI0022B09E8D|nr:hypothetical protein [Rhodococcus yunnanensis]MCZ4278476.1 hypothetical protein [Rhodococcus yunnanensis]